MTKIIGPPKSRRRRRWAIFGPLALALALVGPLVLNATATNQGGFEIDAGSANLQGALYSGNDSPAGDDWTKGGANNGVFKAHTAGGTIAQPGGASCYGSSIDKGDATGTSAFICDGNSDPTFKNSQPEQNIVSPSGKTPDASWPIKPGNVRPKNDFSHAYVYTRLADSPCTASTGNTDTILYLGGHVSDNEGDHFWGFEFDKNPPDNFSHLTSNDGSNFNLVFHRSIGDILVSFTVPGNAGPGNPVVVEVFRVTGFNADGSAIFTLATAQAGCPASQPQGLTQLATNVTNDITAPPWNVPVCDPTAEDSANQCRLANGAAATGDHTLAPRDFAEASVDLAAFGITPCFTNVIFTSRSAHVLTGADIQDVGGANFPLCGTKSGTKFEDTNGNGTQDSGESGLSGWTIKLYNDANGNQTLDAGEVASAKTATTAADGSYSFSALGTGDYIVCEVQQSNWFESRPFAGMSGLPSGESVTSSCGTDSGNATKGYAFHMSGTDLPGNDFGNFRQGTKSGVKFQDTNANGSQDAGEPGLNGWTINAYADTNGNGVRDNGETTVAATTTTATSGTTVGAYNFSLNPGKYVVCEVMVNSTWKQSKPSGNTICNGTTNNDLPTLGPAGYAITVTSGSTDPGNDFGNFQQGTKSGLKFNDLNANGSKDAGEPGLGGWTIRAYVDSNGNGQLDSGETTVAASATTASSGTVGSYTLTLDPGKYVVCEVQQATWFQSAPSNTKCSGNGVSDIAPGGFNVTITSGSTETGNNFGNFQKATIAGTKFKDIDNNGARGLGEGGLQGWTIHVYNDAGGTAGSLDATDALVDTQTTDANGSYTSAALGPGTYFVCEAGQSGWLETYPGALTTGSTSCAAKDGGRGWKITLTSGNNATLNDFGNTPQSHINVGFVSDATLFGGGPATKATSITCHDSSNGSLADQDASGNGYTSPKVTLDQSSLTCTITFTDP